MNTINVNHTIENYLSGTASKAEEAWLMGEMQKNPTMAREVELRRKTNEILVERSILELRSKLEAIEMKKRSSGSLRRSAMKASKYAAAVALVALISALLYFTLRSNSGERLYAKYYTPYEAPGAARSAGDIGNTLIFDAIESYKAKDYQTAISYLEQALNVDQSNMESVFMYGMANMEVKNYPEATGSFTKVLQHNDNLFLEDAAWYLGLSYMMDKQTERAVRQFEFIAASNSRYNKEARKLAKRLK